jgi:hypothetical protein
MGRSISRTPAWLKRVLYIAGALTCAGGAHWLWEMRDIWPRATSDIVQEPILEAIGVIVGGLYLVSKGR